MFLIYDHPPTNPPTLWFAYKKPRSLLNITASGLQLICSTHSYGPLLTTFQFIKCRHRSTFLQQKPPWLQSARELYRPSDRLLLAKLVPAFVDGGCRTVRATNPHGRILGILDRSRYYFLQVAPQLYSRGWSGPQSRPTTSQKIW
jgi:hypothetical protein